MGSSAYCIRFDMYYFVEWQAAQKANVQHCSASLRVKCVTLDLKAENQLLEFDLWLKLSFGQSCALSC